MEDSLKEKYMEIYIDFIGGDIAKSTRERKKSVVKRFLEYLDERKIEDITHFDVNVVYEYIDSMDYASATISYIEFQLRQFFEAMFRAGVTDTCGRKVFPVINSDKRERLLSLYATEEIRDMVSSIPEDSLCYTRNKCMVLMAAQMGLRTGDILGLKFKEIKWDKDLIEKVQQKTGTRISVPLPENVKLILIDYIKNHRPKSESENVFLKQHDCEPFGSNILYGIVSNAFHLANVEIGNRKHGGHALRHSFATRLLRNDTPLPIITSILGHKNMNTTRQYLSISINELRKLALEVPSYENH